MPHGYSARLPLRLRAQALRRSRRLLGAVHAEAAPLGFDSVACGEVDLRHRERTTFFAIHWPEEWRRFYLAAELVERDPVVEALHFRTDPSTWDDLRADRRMAALGREGLDRLIAHAEAGPVTFSAAARYVAVLEGEGRSLPVAFAIAPGMPLTMQGPPEPDTAQLSARARFAITPGAALTLGYDGRFGSGYTQHAAFAAVNVSW